MSEHWLTRRRAKYSAGEKKINAKIVCMLWVICIYIIKQRYEVKATQITTTQKEKMYTQFKLINYIWFVRKLDARRVCWCCPPDLLRHRAFCSLTNTHHTHSHSLTQYQQIILNEFTNNKIIHPAVFLPFFVFCRKSMLLLLVSTNTHIPRLLSGILCAFIGILFAAYCHGWHNTHTDEPLYMQTLNK